LYAIFRYARRQAVARRFAAAKIYGKTCIDRYVGTEMLRIPAV